MFSKTSIQSFVYDLIDVFMFPTDDAKEIYLKNKIQKCFLYQNLTNTDSTFLYLVFICSLSCNLNEKMSRDITFPVLVVSKVLSRSDVSDNFWVQYNVQKKKKELKKQVGLYKVEDDRNANILTIVVNPKDYFEKYKDYSVNKKHKGVKRNTPGMDFEAYSGRISSLHKFCPQIKKKIEQKEFQIMNDSMQMRSVC